MMDGVINHRLSKKKKNTKKKTYHPPPQQQINKNKQIETKNLYNQL